MSCVRVVSIVVLLSLQNIAVSATGETDSLLHEPRTIQGESSPAVTMAEKGMELLLAGTTAHDQKLLSEAEALLQQAIAMQPELPQANMGLSSILMMKPYASMEERREAYQQALHYLEVAKASKGLDQGMKYVLERRRGRLQNEIDSMNALASTLQQLEDERQRLLTGEERMSFQRLEAAIHQQPNDAMTHLAYAKALESADVRNSRSRYMEAYWAALESAFRLAPDNREVRLTLASAWMWQKEFAKVIHLIRDEVAPECRDMTVLNLVWRLDEEHKRYQRLQEDHPGVQSLQAKLAELEELPALMEQMPDRSTIAKEAQHLVLEQARKAQEDQTHKQDQ